MVINFRVRKISRGARKLSRTLMLVKEKKKENAFSGSFRSSCNLVINIYF
jgi:hypothetical protein